MGEDKLQIVVQSLLAGTIAPLGPNNAPSAIHKTPVSGKVKLTLEGLVCDEQGDRKVHGGPEKAVHHYSYDHYATWHAELGYNARLNAPGGFGENISSSGLDEHTVAVGDRFRIGSALLEVSQGRQPCWKLNAHFNVTDMAVRVQTTGRTGWYYRVLEEGFIQAGDEIVLVDRRAPEWTLHRIWHLLYVDTLNYEQLQQMTTVPALADGWKKHAIRRLENQKVEDWTSRLHGSNDHA